MKNTCIKCNQSWNVFMNHHVKLDEIDRMNLEWHGQLISICEDCSDSGECESVLL